jgi:hypothetical protein
MRTLNDAEGQLVAHMGIYGCWLLKHGKKIGNNNLAAKKLYDAYAMYHRRAENFSAAILMNVIEDFIKNNNYEPLKKSYQEALDDLLS